MLELGAWFGNLPQARHSSEQDRETPDLGQLRGLNTKCHSQSLNQIAFRKGRGQLARKGHHERCHYSRRSWFGDICPDRVD